MRIRGWDYDGIYLWYPVERDYPRISLLKACLFSWLNNNNMIMIHLSHWDQHLLEKGRVLSRWLNCIGLLLDNMIVLVIVSIFSIQLLNLLGAANLTEVSNWQAVTQNLRVGLLLDIFRISDFFWKLGGGIIIEHGTILCSLRYYVIDLWDLHSRSEESGCIVYFARLLILQIHQENRI